jgi:hypothetical protein
MLRDIKVIFAYTMGSMVSRTHFARCNRDNNDTDDITRGSKASKIRGRRPDLEAWHITNIFYK